MKPIELLVTVIYFASALFAIFYSIEYDFRLRRKVSSGRVLLILLTLIYIIVFGTRSSDTGTDTIQYIMSFNDTGRSDFKDFGFGVFLTFLRPFTDAQGFLIAMAAVYLGGLYFYINLKYKDICFIFFFMFSSMFFFESLGINIVRQGIACVLTLLVLAMLERKKYVIALIGSIIAASFQGTIVIILGFWLVSNRIKLKYALWFYVISIVVSYLGYGLNSISSLLPALNGVFENRLSSVLNNASSFDYQLGFRPTFVAFNSIFIIIGLLIFYKGKNIANPQKYLSLLVLFILISCLFFLCFNLPYSDRIGILGWIFIPELLVPLLYQNKLLKYSRLKVVMLCIIIFITFKFLINGH